MMNRLKEMGRAKAGAATVCGVAVLAAIGVLGYRVVSDPLPDDAVLRYGDTVVTQDDLQDRVEILGALYGVQRPDDDAEGKQFDKDAAKSMAVSLILEKAVADHDIEVPDRKAQDELDKLIDDQLVGGRQAFVDWLAQAGISEQDVLDEIKRQLGTSMLVERVVEDVPEVTAEDVRAAYDEHRDRMVTPEARQLLNIVVKTRSDAQRVVQEARSGADFADLAATWSLDGSTRTKGGDLGLVTADQLEPAYAEAAFHALRGSVFGPVHTQYGWNVGKVAAVQPSQPLSFAKVEKVLAQELRNKARLDVWRDYLGDLLKKADVEYADDYRPDDPTAPPSDLPETAAPDPAQ